MELSNEDTLRLHVLLANAEAVRIDENAMAVYGLEGERELKVQLNPNCRQDRYLTQVREMLSTVVLDSPGGYPVFLRRWTRMGQIDHEQMDRLLKLGEPEAVMAVVCSPGLTDELARRAWWAAPYAEHARRMLGNPRVAHGPMGAVLAEYLVEHLPFETEHGDIMETVRLVLQPGLVEEEARKRLWASGRSKASYRIGFLEAQPDELPEPVGARHDRSRYSTALEELAEKGNSLAGLLAKLLDDRGQTFIEAASEAMRRPADQDVVCALFNAIGRYFAAARPQKQPLRTCEAITAAVDEACEKSGEVAALLGVAPGLEPEIRAMQALALVDEGLVTPIFARTDAVGSVMRKKIEPVTQFLREQFAVLRGAPR